MCQEAVRRLCSPSESGYVRKVARLLAQPLRSGPLTVRLDLRSLAVFFGGPPYLLWIDEGREAGHELLTGRAQDDDTRIADEVQMVACWQPGSKVVAYRS
jgi:hypothetical protein